MEQQLHTPPRAHVILNKPEANAPTPVPRIPGRVAPVAKPLPEEPSGVQEQQNTEPVIPPAKPVTPPKPPIEEPPALTAYPLGSAPLRVGQTPRLQVAGVGGTGAVGIASGAAAALLQEGFRLCERQRFDQALSCFDRALKENQNLSDAYLGKLLCELQVRRPQDLASLRESFTYLQNYQLALRCADPARRQELLMLSRRNTDSAHQAAGEEARQLQERRTAARQRLLAARRASVIANAERAERAHFGRRMRKWEAEELLSRGLRCVRRKKFSKAEIYLTRVLDDYPTCADAHLGMLLVSLQVSRTKYLLRQPDAFADNPHYILAVHYDCTGRKRLEKMAREAERRMLDSYAQLSEEEHLAVMTDREIAQGAADAGARVAYARLGYDSMRAALNAAAGTPPAASIRRRNRKLLRKAAGAVTGAAYYQASRLYVQVCQSDPTCAEAYAGLLLCDMQCPRISKLAGCKMDISANPYYLLAMTCASGSLKKRLQKAADATAAYAARHKTAAQEAERRYLNPESVEREMRLNVQNDLHASNRENRELRARLERQTRRNAREAAFYGVWEEEGVYGDAEIPRRSRFSLLAVLLFVLIVAVLTVAVIAGVVIIRSMPDGSTLADLPAHIRSLFSR